MKSLTLILLILCFICAADTLTTNENRKEGIYYTFKQFKENRPSTRRSFSLAAFGGNKKGGDKYYRINRLRFNDKMNTKTKGFHRNIWGCFFNNKVYISHDATSELYILNNYAWFKTIPLLSIPKEAFGREYWGGTIIEKRRRQRNGTYILYLKSGKIRKLTHRRLRKIIKDDDALSKELKMQTFTSMETRIDFLERYCSKKKKNETLYLFYTEKAP